MRCRRPTTSDWLEAWREFACPTERARAGPNFETTKVFRIRPGRVGGEGQPELARHRCSEDNTTSFLLQETPCARTVESKFRCRGGAPLHSPRHRRVSTRSRS